MHSRKMLLSLLLLLTAAACAGAMERTWTKVPVLVLVAPENDARIQVARQNVIAHELGHAIGLGHNDDPTTLMCGRPAPCRPSLFQSQEARFFPLTDREKALLLKMYPPQWTSEQ